MFEVKAEVQIDRPIGEVFSFVADNENDPQWCVPVVETSRVAGDRPGLGARYTFASQVGLFKPRGEFEITAFDQPALIGWRGRSPFSTFWGQYHLQTVTDGSTRLEETVTFKQRGLWRLLEASMRSQFEVSYDRQLQRLKRLLERRAGR